jgi:hypothetical protein
MGWYHFAVSFGRSPHLAKPVVLVTQMLVALLDGCITLTARTLHINSFYWNDYSVLF